MSILIVTMSQTVQDARVEKKNHVPKRLQSNSLLGKMTVDVSVVSDDTACRSEPRFLM